MVYDPFQQYSLSQPTTFGNVRVGGVRMNTGNRGNPNYLGGAVDVGVGNNNLRVPNAVLQQILHELDVNQGRLQFSDYFGQKRPSPQMPYAEYSTLQKRINDYAPQNSRLWMEGRPLSQLDEPMYQQNAINREANNINLNNGGVLTEKRNAQGEIIGGDALRMQELRKQSRMIQVPNSRVQTLQRDRAAQPVYDILDQIRKYQPTTSNLPITEKVIA